MDVRAEASMAEGRTARRSFVRKAAVFAAPFLIVAAAVGVVMLLVMTAPKPEKNEEPPLPIAVEIVPARAVETALRVTSQGEVKAKQEAELAAQAAGQVLVISSHFEPGAYVEEGEVLVRIDPAQYKLAVDRSRSQVARAGEALARARADAALAERDWKELGLKGDPSELTLQKPQVNAALADLRTAEAAVGESQLNLARTEIRAPFDGRVKTRLVNVGDYVAPGTPIASVFAVQTAQVRVPLTDADLAVLGLSPGFIAGDGGAAPTARLTAVVGGQRREWDGRLALIEAAVDPATRLVYGLVEVEDPFSASNAAPLTPGMFVAIRIESGQKERLVSIPRSALKKNQYVWVVGRDLTISSRSVAPVMGDESTLYFNSGLKAGERVVASFLPSPREGMKVRDIDAPPPKKEAASKPAKGKKVADADKKAND